MPKCRGDPGAIDGLSPRRTSRTAFQKAERIAVPASDIEVARHIVVIELGIEAHEIMDNIAARRRGAQDVDLFAVEADDLVRSEPP